MTNCLLVKLLQKLNIKHVRVLAAGLKAREFDHLVNLAAPKMRHSFDFGITIDCPVD